MMSRSAQLEGLAASARLLATGATRPSIGFDAGSRAMPRLSLGFWPAAPFPSPLPRPDPHRRTTNEEEACFRVGLEVSVAVAGSEVVEAAPAKLDNDDTTMAAPPPLALERTVPETRASGTPNRSQGCLYAVCPYVRLIPESSSRIGHHGVSRVREHA